MIEVCHCCGKPFGKDVDKLHDESLAILRSTLAESEARAAKLEGALRKLQGMLGISSHLADRDCLDVVEEALTCSSALETMKALADALENELRVKYHNLTDWMLIPPDMKDRFDADMRVVREVRAAFFLEKP